MSIIFFFSAVACCDTKKMAKNNEIIIPVFDGEDYSMSVSYKHLDVYKRKAKTCAKNFTHKFIIVKSKFNEILCSEILSY